MHELFPPFRFRLIEPTVYVGSYPTLRNLRFICRLKLKTIISLIPEPPIQDLLDFCGHYGIKSVHLPTDKYKEDSFTLTAETVNRAIEIILDTRNHPVYIHCLDGANISTTVVMCFRKLFNWKAENITTEAQRYCSELSPEQLKFFKHWKGGNITLPESEHVSEALRWYIYHWDKQPVKLRFPHDLKSKQHPPPVQAVKKKPVKKNPFISAADSLDDPAMLSISPPASTSHRTNRGGSLIATSPPNNISLASTSHNDGYHIRKSTSITQFPSFVDRPVPPTATKTTVKKAIAHRNTFQITNSAKSKESRRREMEALALEQNPVSFLHHHLATSHSNNTSIPSNTTSLLTSSLQAESLMVPKIELTLTPSSTTSSTASGSSSVLSPSTTPSSRKNSLVTSEFLQQLQLPKSVAEYLARVEGKMIHTMHDEEHL